MNDLEAAKLLERVSVMYDKKYTAEDYAKKVREWLPVIGSCSARRMDNALDIYNRQGNRYAPRAGDLLQIYYEIEENERRNAQSVRINSGDMDNACPICGGSGGAALVSLTGDVYGVVGLKKCPCQHPGQLAALQNGRRVTLDAGKRLKDGNVVNRRKLTVWLDEYNRLCGEYTERKTPPPQAPPEHRPVSKQAGLFSFSGAGGIDDIDKLPL